LDIKKLKDEEIISRIKEDGSSKCFEVLYNRYHEKVRGKCQSFVKNREIAEELVENIFIRAFEKLPSLKQLSSFSSWLYSITYNQCIDYLREKKRLHYPEWNRVNEIPEILDETEEIIQDINYENLCTILELIHPEEKALLLMKYQDELSMKQISTALRISENAAKMRLKRARTRVVFLYKENFFPK
jgi:RNA polymerase sigma-70 factor (ECF subfamily)